MLLCIALLWMLPFTEAAYDFRTDVKHDLFGITTAVGQTGDNVTLTAAVYGGSLAAITLSSSINETVNLLSYNATTRVLDMTGFTANKSRTMDVAYDVAALEANPAIDTFVSRLPFIWYLCLVAFVPLGLASIFWYERRKNQ